MFRDIEERVVIYECDKCGRETDFNYYRVCTSCKALYCSECYHKELTMYDHCGWPFQLCKECLKTKPELTTRLLELYNKIVTVQDYSHTHDTLGNEISNLYNKCIAKIEKTRKEKYYGSYVQNKESQEVLLR